MKVHVVVRAACACVILAVAAPPRPEAAQRTPEDAYPDKPIRMLVGFPVGGGADVAARVIGPRMSEADVSVRDVKIAPARPKIGGSVTIAFTLVNKLAKRQKVMADFIVHFVKARGTGAKTFKMKAVDLPPKGNVKLSKKIVLKQLTTRKHYPGVHRVEALLNGSRRKLGSFTLLAAR